MMTNVKRKKNLDVASVTACVVKVFSLFLLSLLSGFLSIQQDDYDNDCANRGDDATYRCYYQ